MDGVPGLTVLERQLVDFGCPGWAVLAGQLVGFGGLDRSVDRNGDRNHGRKDDRRGVCVAVFRDFLRFFQRRFLGFILRRRVFLGFFLGTRFP